MNQETITTLTEALQKDQALREKISSAKTFQEKAAIFAQSGHPVSAEELKQWCDSDAGAQGALSDAELTTVAGGFFRNCVAGAHYKTVTLAMRKSGGDPST
jgi:predicted ribosomally synthesized peptide with nif11-like leader